VETSPRRSALHYALKLDDPTGAERRIEFDDVSGADLAVAPRDAVALLYGRKQTLDAVMNLSTGRVSFVVAPGPCFIASAVYGPFASETDALRKMRDQHLMPTRVGRLAVSAYYWTSPPVARAIGCSPRLRAVARTALDAVVRRIG
jgi:hypothetical protein